MNKFLSLAVVSFIFSLNATAVTPFKNLYVEAEVVPSEAGNVYLTQKNDTEQPYVKEVSSNYGPKVFIKATLGENGSQDQYNTREGYEMDASGALSNYEVKLLLEPEGQATNSFV